MEAMGKQHKLASIFFTEDKIYTPAEKIVVRGYEGEVVMHVVKLICWYRR